MKNEVCTGSQWRHRLTAIAHEVQGLSTDGDVIYHPMSNPTVKRSMSLAQFRNEYILIEDTRPVNSLPTWEVSAKMVLNWAYSKHKVIHAETPYKGPDLLAFTALCGLVGEVPPDVATDAR